MKSNKVLRSFFWFFRYHSQKTNLIEKPVVPDFVYADKKRPNFPEGFVSWFTITVDFVWEKKLSF